jgi:ABC-2 type transport system permease protein
MNAIMKQLAIQFRMDLRDKGILLTYYIVPLLFYAVVGAVFSSINPLSRLTLTGAMSIFAVSMGAVIGIPAPLVSLRENGALRAYKVNGIPGWAVLLVTASSAFLHLSIVTAIISITGPRLFGASVPAHIGWYIVIMAILLFTSICVGLMIGSVAKNQPASVMLSQGVFLPSLMLGGIMFPADMLPSTLRQAGLIFPATHAMNSFRMLAYQLPGSDHLISLFVLAGIGIAALLVAVIRFQSSSR